jgi:ribonucleotide reductase beta subunit family protein with ferritin-like domain
MFPIKYQAIWEFYKKAEASFWTGKRCQCRGQRGNLSTMSATQVLAPR